MIRIMQRIRKCPATGLARAAWYRDLAALIEARNPDAAAHLRGVAESIETGALDDLPLVKLMGGEHVKPPR